ncbi:thioredoxin family protein [Synechococcus sp. BA-132 BA5]|uniref:thioredoxin family protein n=1 Tax=Synechococcus sp. BA-132 BA5 TaxID=3110252 RepID=UPI002B1FE0FD|nr:thioredoxin family protein [Synechococcus sp. BA-132 BA5]MEA5414707.1 thioredoxin family protein [Synechococcus sp. BA-132 BA5]
MVLTASTMLALGTQLPVAAMQTGLRPVTGGPLSATALEGRPVLVLFLCPHCPFVKHVEAELTRLQDDLGGRASLIGICSNSTISHPQDGPAGMVAQARARGWTFPYLQDPDQDVARAFQAACTPDPFLFDARHRLAYRGQLDGSRPGAGIACDGRDLRAALKALLEGRPVPEPQQPAIGCNIKWHGR